MKKTMTIIVTLVVASLTLHAQNTLLNFEELLLGSGNDTLEKYWSGADQSGGFTSKGVYFDNSYTASISGDYWSGFVYSNSSDTVTMGNNNFGVYAKENQDNQFVIAYGDNRSLAFDGGKFNKLHSIAICNTSYTALSLKNGDAYAKKFGGESGNEADSLKLTIKKYYQGTVTDSTSFMLADFRFADNAKDYISKEWQTIDLSAFSAGVDSISFNYASSDVGDYGINTPLYIAIDNIAVSIVDEISNTLTDSKISIFPNPAKDYISIQGANIQSVDISNLNGAIVLSSTQQNLFIGALSSGVYLMSILDINGNLSHQKLVIQ